VRRSKNSDKKLLEKQQTKLKLKKEPKKNIEKNSWPLKRIIQQ